MEVATQHVQSLGHMQVCEYYRLILFHADGMPARYWKLAWVLIRCMMNGLYGFRLCRSLMISLKLRQYCCVCC